MEELFFAERDRELLETLRRRLSAEEAQNLLAAATGVADTIAIKELSDLATPNFLAILGIFPMAEVAWCDGNVSAAERQAILKAVAEMGVQTESPSHQLLDRWLTTRPATDALTLWTNYVQAICATLNPETVAKLKKSVIGRAQDVARATGGILGMGSKISADEEASLMQLAKAFDTPVGNE